MQLIVFLLVAVGVFIIGNLVGIAIASGMYGMATMDNLQHMKLSAPHVIDAMWVIQVVGTTFPVMLAPVFFALVIVRQPQQYLKISHPFPWQLLVLIFCLMFISAPVSEYLSNINEKMVLPDFLKGLQQWMKDKEDQTRDLELLMFKMDSVWAMLKNLVLVGLLTAIAEEFMFRGVIQTIFTQWTKNYHVAIWITAIIFSAIHVQFFGFLPRLMLGVLFGYFVAWSGSIWTSVWAHFINNGTVIVMMYLYDRHKTKINPDDPHMFNWIGYVISLLIVLFLLYIYRGLATTKKPLPEY